MKIDAEPPECVFGPFAAATAATTCGLSTPIERRAGPFLKSLYRSSREDAILARSGEAERHEQA
jgi:hypothetical protein